ncbi:MAG: hypothetical protein ACTSSA_11190, partial [Candidatus Freyarchaeota archaeon]
MYSISFSQEIKTTIRYKIIQRLRLLKVTIPTGSPRVVATPSGNSAQAPPRSTATPKRSEGGNRN